MARFYVHNKKEHWVTTSAPSFLLVLVSHLVGEAQFAEPRGLESLWIVGQVQNDKAPIVLIHVEVV